MTKKDFQKLNKKNNLPDQPGVYYFLKGEKILYIGKATSLRSRVASYFRNDLIETRGPILVDMVTNADRIMWETTDSVLEALILETNLIKKHQPWANTREKDDKSFNYVCITKEKLPKVILVRGKNLEPKKYKKVFGPYPNGVQLREALKIVRRIFPFLDDKNSNYIEFYKQINLVPDLKDTKLYLENIKNIKLFFSGKKKQIYTNLQKQMKEYAKQREFEKAGEIKRQLFALQHINDVALIKSERKVVLERTLGRSDGDGQRKFSAENFRGESENNFPATFRIEAYDIAHMGGRNMVGVMTVVENGQVDNNEYRKFKIKTQNGANDTGALREVLERRLAHPEWRYPNLIVMDGGVAQLNVAKKVLASAGAQIPIVSVLKDERHKPKDILGDKSMHLKYEREILLVNSESHRFAINYHKNMRDKNFLK